MGKIKRSRSIKMRERKENELAFNHVTWDGVNLQITFAKEILDNIDTFQLQIQSRYSNKKRIVSYKRKAFLKEHIIIIPLKELEGLDKGRWDFFIEVESNKDVRKKRIGLYAARAASELIRYLKPIINNGTQAFIPYLTEKNGLSIHCANMLQLEDISYNVIRLSKQVLSVKETDTKVFLNFSETLNNKINDTRLVMKSGDSVFVIPMNIDTDGKTLIVRKKDLHSVSLKGKWNLYLQITKGHILERYGINVQVKYQDDEMKFLVRKQVKQMSTIIQHIKGQVDAENLRVEDGYITFDISSKELKHANKVEFYLKKRQEPEIITLDVKRTVSGGKEQIIIPASQLKEKIAVISRWDLYMELSHDHVKVNRRIGNYNVMPLSEKDKRAGYLMLNEAVGISPYLTKDNEFSLYFCTEEQYMNSKYPAKTKLHEVSMNKEGLLQLTASIHVKETNDFVVDHVTLRLRQDKSQVIEVPCAKEVSQDKNSRKVKAELNISQLELEQFYWDFFITITLGNGDKRHVRLNNDNYLISKKLKHGMFRYTINTPDEYMIYPYITMNDCLSLTYRQIGEFESFKHKINEYTAYFLYILLGWYFAWKPIWLIHEKYSETAQDNSFYFFKYCYENHYNKKIYYVIKKGSADEKNLAPYKKRIVYFMSVKHLLLLLGSKLIVSSETKGHGYAWRVSQGAIREFLNEKKYVFLQHGVLGLKRVDNTFKANSSNGADLFVVSSDFEKEIVKSYFGYNEENVIVTGLSRWDALEDKSLQNTKKEIFLMPTWRNWLEEVEDDKFVLSDYYHEYNSLIQSEKLSQLLKENDITLNFYVHPKFMPYVANFTSSHEHINVIQFGEAKINDLIMRSSLLITDYSSVAWETYYQKKPVLFFHFDLDKYIENQGSYMDLRNDVFGEVAYNSSELVDKLRVYINNGFKEKEEFSSIRNNYFKHVDHDNSSRIYKYISEREKSLVKSDGILKVLKRSYLLKYVWRKYKQNPIVGRIGMSMLNILR